MVALLKLAEIFKIAAFFSFATPDIRSAIQALQSIIEHNELLPIAHNYSAIMNADSDTELTNAFIALRSHITDLKTKYDDRKAQAALNVVLESAEDLVGDIDATEEIEDPSSEAVLDTEELSPFAQGVIDATELAGVEEGKQEALSGGFTVSQDPEKKKERMREYMRNRRINPITREELLEMDREAQARLRERDGKAYALNVAFRTRKARIMKTLMSTGLSREQAEERFKSMLIDTVQQRMAGKLMQDEEHQKRLQEQGLTVEDVKKRMSGSLDYTDARKQQGSDQRLTLFNRFIKNIVSVDENIEKAALKSRPVLLSRKRDRIRNMKRFDLVNSGLSEEDADQRVKSLSLADVDALGREYLEEAKQLGLIAA